MVSPIFPKDVVKLPKGHEERVENTHVCRPGFELCGRSSLRLYERRWVCVGVIKQRPAALK